MYRFLSTLILALGALQPAFAVSGSVPTSAAPAEEIRIGMVNALSGPTQALGTELRLGSQLYLDKVNAAGGIHGKKISLISYDDGYEPAKTIDYTRKLLEEDNVFLLFGYVGTPTSRVAVPIANRAGIPYIAPFTGAGFLRKPLQPYVLNVRAGYMEEAETLTRYLVDKRKISRIAMLIQDDGYGSAGREVVQRALGQRGVKLVGVAKYTRNTVDIQPALAKLKETNPEAIILIGAYAPCAAFIREAKRQDFNPLFMNISFVGTSALVEALGPDSEGVYISQVLPSPEKSQIPLIQQFREDMLKTGQTQMSYGALEGYINAAVLTRLLDKAGPDATRQDIMTTAHAMTAEDIGGMTIKYGPDDHQALDRVYLTQVQQGKLVNIKVEVEP